MKTNPESFAYGTAPTPTADPTNAARGSDAERGAAPRGLRRLGQAFSRRASNPAPASGGSAPAGTGLRQRLDLAVDARPLDGQLVGAFGRQPGPACSSEPTPMQPTSASNAPPRLSGSLPIPPTVPAPIPGREAPPPGAAPANMGRAFEELIQGLDTRGQPGPGARNLSFWTYAQQDDARALPNAGAWAARNTAGGQLGSPIVLRDDAPTHGVLVGGRAPDSPPPLFGSNANTSVGLELWRRPFVLPELWDEDESDDSALHDPWVLSPGVQNDALLQRLGPALELTESRRDTPSQTALQTPPPRPASPGEPVDAAGSSGAMDASLTSPASSGGSSFGCAGALRFDAQ